MKRDISLEEISDGKLYGSGDMVKVGCDDCRGCSACCRGMGSSIVLDPYDVFRLETGLGLSFEGLLAEAVELNLVDGMILPNLKMSGEGEACSLPTLRFHAEKWRSGTGAYVFYGCSAVWPELGTWSGYSVESHMIS